MKILILILGVLTCGGTIEYPDCSFCLMDNTTNDTKGCHGDCQLNSYTNLCEFKGTGSIGALSYLYLLESNTN